jgi:hypothetical protein
MQNSLFASEKFIEASRDFVCIRIETYESKDSEKMVRSLLGGSFANTSFCVFDPQGRKRLSRSGRSPGIMAGRGQGENAIVREMNKIVSSYKNKRVKGPALLQDFDTFRQALNVASADQRLLLVVTSERPETRKKLEQVLSEKEMVGRFHLDQVNDRADKSWQKSITGESKTPGVLIVHSGPFGLKGKLLKQLPESTSASESKAALLKANLEFAAIEKRKVYSDHVFAGLRQGIFFENEIPYGEDRNGDGKIDNQKKGRRRN